MAAMPESTWQGEGSSISRHFASGGNLLSEEAPNVRGYREYASKFISLKGVEHLELVRKDYGWGENVALRVPYPEESIMAHAEGFLNVYMYPFMLGPIDGVVLDVC